MKILRVFFSTVFLLVLANSMSASDAQKIRVLVVTGGHDFEKEPFFKLFQNFACQAQLHRVRFFKVIASESRILNSNRTEWPRLGRGSVSKVLACEVEPTGVTWSRATE